jgi:hypothetical protein
MAIDAKKLDSGKGWTVSDRSKAPPVLRFEGTQEECECVATALNALARQQYGKLVAAEHRKRLEGLHNEGIRALDDGLRALNGK